jgi:PAS domain S-box-containing protein
VSPFADSEKSLTEIHQADNGLAAQLEMLEKKNRMLSGICEKQKQVIDNLEAIMRTAPEVAFQQIDQDGTLFRWNQTSQRLYGYPEEEILGRRIQDVLLSGAAAMEFERSIETVWLTGKPTPSAGWHISKNGGGSVFVRACAIPIVEQGAPVAICTMQVDATDTKRVEDIFMRFNSELEKRVEERTAALKRINVQLAAEAGERLRAQEALQESEQRFRIFADHNYAWEYWIGPDLKMIHVTPSCERITGYPAQAFMANEKLLTMIVHPDDIEKFSCLKAETISAEKSTAFDFRIQTRDGRLRWISHICQPVFSDDNQFLGRRASNMDVTAQRWAEAELNATRNELEHRVEQRTSELKRATQTLEKKQADLLRSQAELEKLNQELMETSKAVSVLAKTLDEKKVETEKKIVSTISSKIIPLVTRLRAEMKSSHNRSELDVITAYLHELTSHLDGAGQVISILSAAEARVAMLIKSGLSTHELADRLNISLLTAKVHRRNIRRKLSLYHSKENLAMYLKSRMGHKSAGDFPASADPVGSVPRPVVKTSFPSGGPTE